ncbi:MAG TPA: TCR/Tet family MFS transporter [Gemmatimonadaceae bacterium]
MSQSPAAPAPARQAAITFIFITVVLDVLAMGIIIPVLPRLVQDFLHGDTARAAEMFGVFATVWALMQFFCSPIIGMLSDRFGRRRVILLSNFGLGLDYIVMALAPTIGWLFVGRVISGITGASFTTAGAYIADVTPKEKRASSYGILGAAWGLGFVLGPALGGILGAVNPRLPFWAAAGMTLLNALYGLLVLPESLPPEKRTPKFEWARANPLGSLKLLRSHHELFGLATVNFLYYLAHQVLQSVMVLYVGYRYNWSARTVGLTLAVIGIGSVIVQGGLVRPVVARIGDRRALVTGLVFGTLGFAAWGLAPTGILFLAAIPLGSLMGFYGPAAQGLMTHRVSASEQGQLQGANSSVQGIAGLVGPGVFTWTFARFIRPDSAWQLPGAPFLLGSLILITALLIALRVTRER